MPDYDDGFAELSNCVSGPVTKCHVSCRKRRRGDTDGENMFSDADMLLRDNTSPTCYVGHETPTSSKQLVKRTKECSDWTSSRSVTSSVAACRRLVRCHSDAVIHQALSTSEEQSNLIGDFSRPHCLPLLSSAKHQDLKSISPDTVSCNQVLICWFFIFFYFLVLSKHLWFSNSKEVV